LVHAEEVFGIVLGLDLGQAIVVVAIAGADAIVAFFHHEVHVRAAGAVGVQSVVIAARPVGDLLFIGRVGIDADDHLAPDGIAITPGGIVGADTMRSSVHRIKVHGGSARRKLAAPLDVLGDGCVGNLLEEISLPIPLHP